MKLHGTSPFAEVLSSLMLFVLAGIVISFVGVVVVIVMEWTHPSVSMGTAAASSVIIHAHSAGMTFLSGAAGDYDRIKAYISVVLPKGTDAFGWLWIVFSLLRYGIWFWIAWLVRGIVNTVKHDRPFDPTNLPRLRKIGLLVVGYVLVRSGWILVNTWWMKQHPVLKGVEPVYDARFSWSLFFCGLLLILIAEVFRRGLALQRDQELTI